MRYISIVLAGACCFIAALWFFAGKKTTFTGPIVEIDAVKGVRFPVF